MTKKWLNLYSINAGINRWNAPRVYEAPKPAEPDPDGNRAAKRAHRRQLARRRSRRAAGRR